MIQMDVRTGDVAANLVRAGQMLEEAAGRDPDVVVLPEMWNTGFAFADLSSLGRDALPASLELLTRFAGRTGACLFGSMPEVSGGLVHNTMFYIDGKGAVLGRYRKIHLFPLMDEDKHMAPGEEVCVFEMPGARVGTCICYDLRFPELTRRQAEGGASIVVISAQFPSPRLSHWEILIKARAIENQLYVAAANRVGRSGGLEFFGNSMVVDPWGEVIARGGEGEEVITADLLTEKVDEVREKLPSLSQRKPEIYARNPAGSLPQSSGRTSMQFGRDV